jgi:hypothetical protein
MGVDGGSSRGDLAWFSLWWKTNKPWYVKLLNDLDLSVKEGLYTM